MQCCNALEPNGDRDPHGHHRAAEARIQTLRSRDRDAPRTHGARADPWRPVRHSLRRGDGVRGLRAGLTVAASIPISVLSISILRYFAKVFHVPLPSILENNIVQTTGNAGQSIASGVI